MRGVGYAWNPSTLTVHVGDTVQWTWAANELVTNMLYTVKQTASPSAITSLEDGFGNDAHRSTSGDYMIIYS